MVDFTSVLISFPMDLGVGVSASSLSGVFP